MKRLVQARPACAEGFDPKLQCGPLSQAKKYKVTLTKLQRVYYQLCLAATAYPEEPACSEEANRMNRSSSRQSKKRWGLAGLFFSKLHDKICWYFYSRLRSLLACGPCAASGSSLSDARGLLSEVYIPPRPPSLPWSWESVRGWRTGVNETAPRRGEGAGESVSVCAHAGVCECESDCVGGGRDLCTEREREALGLHQTTQISTQSQRYRKEDQQKSMCMRERDAIDTLAVFSEHNAPIRTDRFQWFINYDN